MTEFSARILDDTTARLDLFRPHENDLPELYALLSDPGVWAHFPSSRHTDPATTARGLEGWIAQWIEASLGTWVVRRRGEERLIGYGGCSVLGDSVWNLGYRFTVDSQGHGFATELSRRAIERARVARPDLPVVAYLLEHNIASAAVARKVGLTVVDRGPDAGNPDPRAVRLVFSDRPLDPEQLATTRR